MDQRDFVKAKQACLQCTKCRLSQGRNRVVFGEGNEQARIMFIGEGPGAEEDRQGRPFVGKAGQLLTKMLAAISLNREDVYIANVVKCRPPGNRVPLPDEIGACLDYLRVQVGTIRPEIIVCLGATAAKTVIDPSFRITRDRGKWIERKGYKMIATYHPAALLRDERKKVEAWEDLQRIRDEYQKSEK
jgi:DNA polymerase